MFRQQGMYSLFTGSSNRSLQAAPCRGIKKNSVERGGGMVVPIMQVGIKLARI
jgi:hypothetical protein